MGGSAEVCLQWNNFRNNVNTVSGTFRGNANLADVTLVCEDGEKVEAHKIALAASSHFQLAEDKQGPLTSCVKPAMD